MQTPSAQSLPAALLAAAVSISKRVADAGAQAWLVGGPVRDLALGRTPIDLDMASALTPEQIEALFERTTSVGKAFGTVLVHLGGVDAQLTTFRRERGFSDARRPDLVEYTDRLEEDARRRDFTCNALYLDPLDDELRDSEGGLRDIGERRLRAVGDPRARFAEDGLRLVRLARFAASLDFEVESATLEAARASVAALSGVSAERRLGELQRIFGAPRSARAIEILARTGQLETLLPGFETICPQASDVDLRVRALHSLNSAGRGLGEALGFALLLEPGSKAAEPAARAILDFLRPSRVLRDRIEAIWKLERAIPSLAAASRASLIRFARAAGSDEATRMARAWITSAGGDTRELDRLQQALASLSEADRFPTPWLSSEDLARAQIERGPLWRRLLEEAETQQLDGQLLSREAALRWIEQRARELRAP